jgi:hypothetical protein
VTASDPSRSAHNALREQLVAAARHEFEASLAAAAAAAQPRRRRRRRWQSLGLVLGATFGVAAAAGAGSLISTGAPVPDTTFPGSRYRPADSQSPQLAIKASDPAAEAPWGVAIYTAANGQPCALLGQVRGVSVGVVREGRFHPFEAGTTGMCGSLRTLPQITDLTLVGGPRPRTILWGRANPTAREMIVTVRGKRHVAPVGRGGAFLFVFSGRYSVADFRTLAPWPPDAR